MAIPLSQIVKVIPGVLSASGSALDLNGLILTESQYAPVNSVLTFATAADVSAYFGSSSTEAAMATIYFKGYKNSSRTPGALLMCRYNAVAVSAFIRSGSMSAVTLTNLKLLSGVLTLSVNDISVTTANITLTSVTSFDDAATSIENAINAVNSSVQVVVAWDTTTKSFIITSDETGAASTISYSTGTLSTGLKLTSATGAVLSQGADIAVVSDLFTSITDQSQNWAGFTTAFIPTQDEADSFASWANDQASRFFYVLVDNGGDAIVSGSQDCLAYQIIANTYAGTTPAYGETSHAANLIGIVASLNFNQLNGRRSIAFRQLDGLAATADTSSEFSALIANGYNFYGNYSANAYATNQWYPGSITGDYKWLDAFAGQIWLNANLQKDIITLFQSEVYLPYATAGRAAIEGCMTSTIEQFKSWGGISTGTVLDDNQIISIQNATGSDPTSALSANGYYIYIGPFAPAMRSERTSPEVYLWYTDGGFIQKLTLNSIEVA